MGSEPVIHSGVPRDLARSLRSWRALRCVEQAVAVQLLGVLQRALWRHATEDTVRTEGQRVESVDGQPHQAPA